MEKEVFGVDEVKKVYLELLVSEFYTGPIARVRYSAKNKELNHKSLVYDDGVLVDCVGEYCDEFYKGVPRTLSEIKLKLAINEGIDEVIFIENVAVKGEKSIYRVMSEEQAQHELDTLYKKVRK